MQTTYAWIHGGCNSYSNVSFGYLVQTSEVVSYLALAHQEGKWVRVFHILARTTASYINIFSLMAVFVPCAKHKEKRSNMGASQRLPGVWSFIYGVVWTWQSYSLFLYFCPKILFRCIVVVMYFCNTIGLQALSSHLMFNYNHVIACYDGILFCALSIS